MKIWVPSFRTLLIGSCAALVPGLALAQEQTPGRTLAFTFDETLGAQTNPSLDPLAGNGTVFSSETGLSFAMSSTTQNDAFNLDGGLGLFVTRDDAGSTTAEVGAPHLTLGYTRDAANSGLEVNLSYAKDRVDRLRTFQDFIGPDGTIILPADPTTVATTGTQEDLNGGLSFEIGRNAPFGLTFSTDYTRTTFSEPGVADTSSASAGVIGRFSYNRQGDVTLAVDQTHATTTAGPSTDTTEYTLGTTYDLSPVVSLHGSVVYSTGDDGTATSATVGALYTLRTGSLAFDLGTDESQVTWQQTLSTGKITAMLSHAKGDNAGTLDQLGAAYQQSINDVSGIAAGLLVSDLHGATPSVTSTDLFLGYNHSLSADWDINLGVSYRMRDDSVAGSANSAGAFVTVSRNFNLGH